MADDGSNTGPDTAPDTTPDINDAALREAINDDVAQLVHDLRCSHAPQEILAEATGHIQQALDALKPWLKEGAGWSTISIADDHSGMPWEEEDITSVMPYSPVSGRRNPIAPPVRLRRGGEAEVLGDVVFSPTYAGPPDSVHGGIIAAVFDEVLAMANVISGTAGFTGTLSIRYHDKTPLNTPIELWGKNVRRDGRKQICKGEMRVNGKVTASAEGLFICAAEQPDSADTPEA
jgi:acyl-coenzyme A thioesterase PaaI-like protein